MSAHTGVSEGFEGLEDRCDLRSLARSLIPALLSHLPDCMGHSRSIKLTRLRWPFAFGDHDNDIMVCVLGKRHLSSNKLKKIRFGAVALPGDPHTSTTTIDKE